MLPREPAQRASQLASGGRRCSCSPGEAPPPRLRCTDHGGKELDQGNARGFVVEVSGSQCQVHSS